MTEKVIEVKEVTLAFSKEQKPGTIPELAQVNLKVQQGHIVSLVGPSGCGKSTLLRLIAGVLSPTAGEVIVFGEKALPGWPGLGFVPQDSLLLPWRTVYDNIRLPLEIHNLQDPSLVKTKVEEALELTNLTGSGHKYPHQLSGGMRQRAALARGLVGDTKVLLLDEPFAALDDLTRTQLHLELLDLQARTGATVLLVTHNIIEAVFLSNRVVVMGEKPGRILSEIDINLEWPRSLKMIGTSAFGQFVNQVRDSLADGWEDNGHK